MADPLPYSAPSMQRQSGPPSRTARLRSVLVAIGWMLLALAAIAFIAAGVLVIIAVAQTARAIRRRRAVIVLSYLEQAVRLNLPLPRMLLAAEQSERGKIAQRLSRVRETIESGASVGHALEMDAPEVPDRTCRLAAAAEHLGQLPSTLRRLVEQDRSERNQDVTDRMFCVVYPLVMFLAICGGVTFFAVFVMPKFHQIFRDFGLQLPSTTWWLVGAAAYLGPSLGILVALVLLLYLGMRLAETFHPSKAGALFAGRWLDRLIWVSPFFGPLARDRGLADVLQLVGESLEAGFPIDRALMEVDALKINTVLHSRIAQWLTGVQSGLAIADAARRSRLPPLLVGMLSCSRASHDAAEACKFLSRYYSGRFGRAAALLRGALVPLMTIFFGIIVCIVALGLFTPMVQLIYHLAPGSGVL